MGINRLPSSQINFLTCFYVLSAGLAHKEVTWVWEKIIHRKEIKGWYTFYQDLAGQTFIIDSIMFFWLFFSFLAALFPHFQTLRFGTFVSYFGVLILQSKPEHYPFGFPIEILPLFFFAFIPNSLLFSEEFFRKVITFLKKNVNVLKKYKQLGFSSGSFLDKSVNFLRRIKMYHFLLIIPLFIIIYNSLSKTFFYKQLFFLLTSLCIIIQIPQMSEKFSCSMILQKLTGIFTKKRSH